MNQSDFEGQKERMKGRSRRKGSQVSAELETQMGSPVFTESSEFRKSYGRSRRNFGNSRKTTLIAGAAIVGFAVAVGVAYTYLGQQYQNVYFPNTMINGIDASGRTSEEVKQMIASQINGYSLTLETRQTEQDVIRGYDIGLHPEYDGTLERLIDEQNSWMWGLEAFRNKDYMIGTMMAYDQERLESVVDQLVCMNPEVAKEPVNAHISEYISGIGYQIVPEEQGSLLNREKVLSSVADAILSLQERLNLEQVGAYEMPTVLADDPGLQEKLKAWNRYVNTTVIYQFGSKREVLDGTIIHQWLSDDGQNGVVLDEAQASQFIKELAREYNTAYQPKTLETSYGKTVTITGGPYGWRMNQSAESAALVEILHSGESQSREPIYSQTANSHDGPDYGNTYVEINLTAQHLYFYKDGKLIVESDFVSGNESKGWGTPAGAYPLTYKQRDATLRGENYETPVSYWMPFNGNIGMHDANWRGSFGGSIYKKNGSHGCVNLPPAVAKTIYENISAGMPVLCYHLSGTESGSTSSMAKPAETVPEETLLAETKPVETNSVETRPVETTAAETRPVEAVPEETTTAGTVQSVPGTAAPGTSEISVQPTPTPQPTPGTTVVPSPGDSSGLVSGPAGEESRASSGVVSGPGA